jgi:Leucine-rich repeat (LRR) protein
MPLAISINYVTKWKYWKRLSLRSNLIEKIEGLNSCVNLEELELYDNKIQVLEGLDKLVNL